MARARAGIEKLVHLTPQTARVLKNGQEQVVPAEEVRVGDTLRVLPGESIPVDGIITAGQTSINQAIMTGESLPVDKTVGDEVSSGTVNQFGAFEMTASKVGEDTSLQRMIRLVQSADAGKAKIVGLADRWATWIVVIALSAAAITWAGPEAISQSMCRFFCLVLVMALAEPRADDAADKAGGDAGGGSGQPAGEDADRALFFQCGADALGQKMPEAQQGDRGSAPGKFGQRGIPADGG